MVYDLYICVIINNKKNYFEFVEENGLYVIKYM